MYLEELSTYPNILAKKIIRSQNIIDLLKNKVGSECPDDTILDDQVFGWNNIDGAITQSKPFVLIDTNCVERSKEIMIGMELYIWVIVENTLMKLPSEFKRIGNRRDVICNEIDKLLANDFSFGKTKLRLKKRNPAILFYPEKCYSGRKLTYVCEDTARVGYPK